jgi:Ras-related protein Rab-28
MTEMEDEDDNIEYKQYKVVVLGDGAVGKTSVCMRFAQDTFTQIYKQTVGLDFFINKMDMPPNYQVALQLWDIGGQSIASKMLKTYIAGADAILICYDITNIESFNNAEDWLAMARKAFKGKPLPYTALVGNKNDLRHLTAVSPAKYKSFAEENGLKYFTMSAKTGDQAQLMFWKVAAELLGLGPEVKPPTHIESVVIPAQIIDSKQHDENVNDGKVPEYTKKKSNCTVS